MSQPCPYPGLRAFFTDERDWYFGRETHVDAMLTCLESSRFLAVVGSSGSGKSSLVFAGLIPALREGQLAGTKRNAADEPAPWSVVDFHPGNNPLDELAAAIFKAALQRDEPYLAGYIRAALTSGDLGLIEALRVAGLLGADREVLIYADQFEELFRFGEKSARATQENALRFARLFVAAAGQTDVRLHLILSMRSEFIGECERFPGLPEIVSRSQFLTPRLSRKQLGQSLGDPAKTVGWIVAPDALTAILNDCGNSPDQLPLAQHVLRRMWMCAAKDGRRELTFEDYRATGGIQNSIARHGQEILAALPQPGGPEVARVLFMALCEQREDGPLVRRLSTREEVEAIAGENRALVPEVIAAFAGDDPGFIREDKGWLDVRHEAILRQWPLINNWRIRETESGAWLRELAEAAKDYEKDPNRSDLWHGKGLRRAEEWMRDEKPSEAWAKRHGVRNWDACLGFLDRSRKHRQKKSLMGFGVLVVAFIIGAFVVIPLRQTANENALRAAKSANDASVASAKRLEVIKTFAETADRLNEPVLTFGKSAFADAEKQAKRLTDSIAKASDPQVPPPDRTIIEDCSRTRQAAENAATAIAKLKASMKNAAAITDDENLTRAAGELAKGEMEIRARRKSLQDERSAATSLIQDAIEARLDEADKALEGILGEDQPTASLVREKDKGILVATAAIAAIDTIWEAALALGFDGDTYIQEEEDRREIGDRRQRIIKTLAAARKSMEATPTAPRLTVWTPETAVPLNHGGRVNRIRFAPKFPPDAPLLVGASEDRRVWFWNRDGTTLNTLGGSSVVNDISFSPQGDAVAAASNGSTVRVLHWTATPNPVSFGRAQIETDAFERHEASITNVEFSHGGQRIASASADRTVRVFDSRSMKQLYFTNPPLQGIVTSVAFHPGDNLVVSGCDDGGVRLHTIDKPSMVLLGNGKMDASARSPEFSADGKLVIAASGDRTARVWTIVSPQEIARLEHPAPVTRATFRPVKDSEGYTFVTTATNGEVRCVRMTNVTTTPAIDTINILEPRHPGAAVGANWSANGSRLATVGGGEALVWEWTGDAPVARVRMTGLHPETSRAEFSPDANFLVTYGGDHVALVWDLTNLTKLTAWVNIGPLHNDKRDWLSASSVKVVLANGAPALPEMIHKADTVEIIDTAKLWPAPSSEAGSSIRDARIGERATVVDVKVFRPSSGLGGQVWAQIILRGQ